MGFKDMMKSFLYETVEDDDDYEEEEETVAASEPKRGLFHRKEEAASAPIEQTTAAPVQSAVDAVPVQSQAPASSAFGQPTYTTPNPYAANQGTSDYLQNQYAPDQLYTTPQVTPAPPQSNFLSRIDEAMVEEAPAQKKAASTRVRRAAAGRNQPVVSRQDFSSVISPIYGTFADEEIIPEALHNAVDLPKPVDATEMVEIISPIYGTMTVPARTKEKVPAIGPAKAASNSKAKKAAPRKESKSEQYSALEQAVEEEAAALAPVSQAAPAKEADLDQAPADKPETVQVDAPKPQGTPAEADGQKVQAVSGKAAAIASSKGEKAAPSKPYASNASYKAGKPTITADLGSYLSRGTSPKNRAGASRAELLEPVLEEQNAKKGSKK